MNNKKMIISAFGALLALLMLVKILPGNPRTARVHVENITTTMSVVGFENLDLAEKPVRADSKQSTENTNSEIVVHVVGCVISPGVYKLPQGSLVDAAVRAAGGFAENARQEAVNLAALAVDKTQIYIPDRDEDQIELSVQDELEGSESRLININTASVEELTRLNGIGAAKANDIIAYRETNGDFQQIEDLMQIRGIKQRMFDKIKGDITVK